MTRDAYGCSIVLLIAGTAAAAAWFSWTHGQPGAAFALAGAVAAVVWIGAGAFSQNWNLVETVVIVVMVAVLYAVIAIQVRARVEQVAPVGDASTHTPAARMSSQGLTDGGYSTDAQTSSTHTHVPSSGQRYSMARSHPISMTAIEAFSWAQYTVLVQAFPV